MYLCHAWQRVHNHDLTFPCRASTVAVCLTLPTCTVTWKPLWKVLAWKSNTISASNIQQIVGFISGLTITIPYSKKKNVYLRAREKKKNKPSTRIIPCTQRRTQTFRNNERSNSPSASVAACPARSTLHADRFLWMLHTVRSQNWPSSIGPTANCSPSRQIPLHRSKVGLGHG